MPNPRFRANNVFIMENISCRFYFMTALVFLSRFCHPFLLSRKERIHKKAKHTVTAKTIASVASSAFCLFYCVFLESNTFSLFTRLDAIRLLDKICRHTEAEDNDKKNYTRTSTRYVYSCNLLCDKCEMRKRYRFYNRSIFNKRNRRTHPLFTIVCRDFMYV